MQATKLLGLEIITELTVRRNLFRPFREREIDGKSLHELTEHSLEVARCAKEIASCETGDEKVAQDAYLAGMLHDVGKLVLADQIPELDILGLGFETDRESQIGLAKHIFPHGGRRNWGVTCSLYGDCQRASLMQLRPINNRIRRAIPFVRGPGRTLGP